jgi:hypothetical protein
MKELLSKEITDYNESILLRGILKIFTEINDNIYSSFFLDDNFTQINDSRNIKEMVIPESKQTKNDYNFINIPYISKDNILQAFKANIGLITENVNEEYANFNNYFETMNIIFKVVEIELKNRYEKYEQNKKIPFGLNHLYEWIFVLSMLRVYIHSFSFKKKDWGNKNISEFFKIKKIFLWGKSYFYNYTKHEIFRNIFLDIIKLLCNKYCPNHLLQPLLSEKAPNLFIQELINNLGECNQEKNNMNSRIHIEILKTIYFSENEEIKKIFKNISVDSNIREIFKKKIFLKFEQNLDDSYELSDSEIFNLNDSTDTFDGKNIEMCIKCKPFKEIISTFVQKCMEEYGIFQLYKSDDELNKMPDEEKLFGNKKKKSPEEKFYTQENYNIKEIYNSKVLFFDIVIKDDNMKKEKNNDG